MASSRFNFLGMFLFFPPILYYGYTRPIPRKLYTEILADNGSDGNYVRDCLVTHKPGLWNKISQQLEAHGFNFPQNIRNK